MKMEIYWPQRKVFMLGLLALFPQILEGHYVAMGWEISRYLFPNKDDDLFEDELRQYRDNGYFQFELECDAPIDISSSGSVTTAPIAYFISSIDSQKAMDDLTHYLVNFQQDRLINNEAIKPADFLNQQTIFHKGLAREYSNQSGSIIKLKWSDLYGEVLDYQSCILPPFWELMLWHQLVAKQLTIMNMGYGKAVTKNSFKTHIQPFVDIIITDQNLIRSIELEPKKASSESQKARIGMNNKIPYVELNGLRRSLVRGALRTDNNPYIFMNYLVGHTNKLSTRSNGLTDLDEKGQLNLTELARQCGFTAKLKPVFFHELTKSSANLKSEVYISKELVTYIEKRYRIIS